MENLTTPCLLYSESDSVTQTFQKYEILCDYTNKKLVKGDREKLHRAQLTFISSIASPADKETMLDLIAHALPYTKKDLSSKALKTATNIGFVALKAVSQTAKVATLGIAGKAVDNLEQLAQQAIVRNAEEIANLGIAMWIAFSQMLKNSQEECLTEIANSKQNYPNYSSNTNSIYDTDTNGIRRKPIAE